MKKIIVLSLVLVVGLLAGGFSSSFFQVSLFPATLSIDGQSATVNEPYRIFNYDNHVYVPLRFIAEHFGAEIDYQAGDKSITIRQAEGTVRQSEPWNLKSELKELRSELVSTVTKDGLKFSLHSEKAVYQAGDEIRVWVVTENTHTDDIETHSAAPFLTFRLFGDKPSFHVAENIYPIGKSELYEPGEMYIRQMPAHFIPLFNILNKQPVPPVDDGFGISRGDNKYSQQLNEHPVADELPVGQYKIMAQANYATEGLTYLGDPEIITLEIMIQVVE